MYKDKRGLSPVIATVLLILVAVIIAAIIFWWIKQFIQEGVQKDIGGGAEPIQNFCPKVAFNSDVEAGGIITVQNNADIPIYGVELKKKAFASVKNLGQATHYEGVSPGGTYTFDSSEVDLNSAITIGDEIIVIPILLGKQNEEQKAYPCDENYVEVTAI